MAMITPENTHLLLLSVLLLIFWWSILAHSYLATWEPERRSLRYGLLTMSCLAILACVVLLLLPSPPSVESGRTPSSPTSWGVVPVPCSTATSSSGATCWQSLPTFTLSTPKDLRCSSESSTSRPVPTSAWSSSTRHRCTRIAPLHDMRLRATCWRNAITSG